MDDPFFAEDDGEFDDFYGNGTRTAPRPSQPAMPRPSEIRVHAVDKAPSLAYPDTPSSVASFVSRSTDGAAMVKNPSSTTAVAPDAAHKKGKKLRRKRSQERFEVAWERDDDVTACFVCNHEFSLLKRKHHCRHCGRVICSDCSSFRRLGSSRGKHRVCSYCSVEIANGGGRPTMAGAEASMLDVEAATPQHHDDDPHGGSKFRQSLVGVFSTKSTESRPPPVSSSRPSGVHTTATKEPTGELLDASDDTWFEDPVDDHADKDKRRGKQDRHALQSSQAVIKQKDSYARPQVVRAPDSLFDVQFTNGNQYDESDDDDHDDFAMPKPTSQSEIAGAPPRTSTTVHHSTAGRLDTLTMDDLQPSSASASYVSSSSQYETALVVVPSISNTRADRTFYGDDADHLVVDDAPGYYDSVIRERSHTQNVALVPSHPTLMPRPSALAVSDGSSGTLVEAPETSTPAGQTPVSKDEDRSPEGKGFTGALKRFFGISKNKRDAQAKQPATSPTPAAAEKTPLPVPTESHHAASPREEHAVAEMPRPTFVAPAQSDHYEDIDAYTPDDDIYDARYTIADGQRSKPEPLEDTFDTPLRHTMPGYVVPSTRADSLMRASVVGAAVTIPESAPPQVSAKKKRSSTRSRRDTFDDLFDMPGKSKAPTSAPAAANLPARSWASPYDAPGGVGVDRFDRPRREDEDDDITRGLGLPVNQALDSVRPSQSQTPWSAVSSYRSTGSATMYATPETYASGRESAYHDPHEAEFHPSSAVADDYGANNYESGRASPANRNIMDDLKPAQVPRGSMHQQNSVDDYFAEFERPTEYVFDSATGTYVSANPRPARQSMTNRSSNFGPEPVSVQKAMGLRDERLRAPPTRSMDVLEPVSEDAPDEIDGIIADKISTLAGELEALKQLLRKRRVQGSPTSTGRASTGPRKQSIFDSDGSDDEANRDPIKPAKAKRRPSSKKKSQVGDAVTHKSRKTRKDSFADLFEDDAEVIGERQGYANRNYEALFQLGQDTMKGAANSDDGTGDKKLLMRARKRGSKTTAQYDRNSDSESENDARSEDVVPLSSRKHSVRNKSEHVSASWENEDDSVQAPSITVEPVRQLAPVTMKKPKRDVIDSLFDSDSDEDMGQLYEATGAAQLPTNRRGQYPEDPSSDSDGDTGDKGAQASRIRSHGSTNAVHQDAMVTTVTVTAAPMEEVHGVSSDEEFSSTLKNLRGRRKTPTPSVKPPLELPSSEHFGTDDDEIDAQDASLVQPSETLRLSLLRSSSSLKDAETSLFASASQDDPAQSVVPAQVHTADRQDSYVETDTGLKLMSEHEVHEDEEAAGTLLVADPVEQELAEAVASLQARASVDQDVHLDHTDVADTPSTTGSVDDTSAPGSSEFDPLAVLEDAKAIPQVSRSGRTNGSSSPFASASTGWETHAVDIREKLKASRFRDSLLDAEPADVLGPSTSLNLDDLFNTADHDEEEEERLSEGDSSFSFEVKPRKRTSKTPTTARQPIDDMREDAVKVIVEDDVTTGEEDLVEAPAEDEEKDQTDILGSIVEESSRDDTFLASSVGDPLLTSTPDVDPAQFQDDWQRMQEQEKERKKKLQQKQRQAQREKLKKQSSSVRSLGKSGSTRAFAPPASSPTASMSRRSQNTGVESIDGSEEKKKKKHRKKAEHGNVEDDNVPHSTPKSEKRRHERHAELPEGVQVSV